MSEGRGVTRLVFRSATDRDIEQVLALWNAAGSAETVTDTREGVLGLLNADPEALLVAESDSGEIVASLIASWDGWRGSSTGLPFIPSSDDRGSRPPCCVWASAFYWHAAPPGSQR
jgi:ribosomal protein S18 acetylase RimI-like enzyme